MKIRILFLLVISFGRALSQENPNNNPVQSQTELQVNDLIEKKAEYHRLTDGERMGYRIKIHFGERESAETVQTKFSESFPEYATHKEYQQPYFVVLVGDFRTKLEAFQSLKKIQPAFPNAFIVKDRVKVK